MQPPNYPQQPPYQQNYPPQPAPQPIIKKPRRWPWIAAIIIALIIGYGAGSAGHSSTATTPTTDTIQATTAPAQPTQPAKPTTVPKMVTTHTFTGTGAKKTDIFTVGDTWKITWTCQGISGIDAPLFIDLLNSDGTPFDTIGGIQSTCKAAAPTTDSSSEHKAGSLYLDVNSGVGWTITIQELK